MFLGIKMTPQGPGKPRVPSVFYCGLDPAALRGKHAELVKANDDDSRFYMLQHPVMTPLQTVPTSTEEHPEVIAAQEKRRGIAAAEPVKGSDGETGGSATGNQKPEPPPLINVLERKAELGRLKVKELQAIVERIKATGLDIETGTGTKAELVDGILHSEGLVTGGTPVLQEEETINAPAA